MQRLNCSPITQAIADRLNLRCAGTNVWIGEVTAADVLIVEHDAHLSKHSTIGRLTRWLSRSEDGYVTVLQWAADTNRVVLTSVPNIWPTRDALGHFASLIDA